MIDLSLQLVCSIPKKVYLSLLICTDVQIPWLSEVIRVLLSILNSVNQELLTEVLDADEDIYGQRRKLVDDNLGHGHVRVGFMHEAEMEESFTEETSPANVPADSDVRWVMA